MHGCYSWALHMGVGLAYQNFNDSSNLDNLNICCVNILSSYIQLLKENAIVTVLLE